MRREIGGRQRERLRSTFLRFRERVAHLASAIHRQLPELTVHDITHLDALWEMGDLVVGQETFLNPAEAFFSEALSSSTI